MMQRFWMVLLIGLTLVSYGCGRLLQLADDDTGPKAPITIEARFDLTEPTPFKAAALGDAMITSGNVVLTNSLRTYTFPLTIDSGRGSATISSMPVGTWNVTVTFYNASNTAVYNGTASTFIAPDFANELVVTVSAAQGDLTLTSSLPVVKMTVEGSCTMILRMDGTLWGFGRNTFGMMGPSSNVTFASWRRLLTNVVDFSMGYDHTIAIKADGSVWASGSNINGEIGLPQNQNGVSIWTMITDPAGAAFRAKKVVSTIIASYILCEDGLVWGTGAANYGQMGIATNTGTFYGFRQLASDAKDVASSGFSTYVLKTDGTVLVSGFNSEGQLGTGTTANLSTFEAVAHDVKAIAVAPGAGFILKNNGTLMAAGRASAIGLVGAGIVPTFNIVLTNVRYITNYYDAAFAVKNDNTLWVTGTDHVSPLTVGLGGSYVGGWTQVMSSVRTVVVSPRGGAVVQLLNGSWFLMGNNINGTLIPGAGSVVTTFTEIPL